ncbi:DUF2937 family protein [Thalassotalea crassostreae]|uniref:DUF2937 family protein n=1 Tax=Thalassotalea crassostreae TaxID=1763536 RepID=UPI000837DB94|nr:DUF2937 family protein [Thalassotalea crassostreae]
MFRFIGSIIDKINFSIFFIAGTQLPGFIQAYLQRISGHLAEAKYQLSKYQDIANLHYQGDLSLMTKRYQQNSDPGISASGEIIANLDMRVTMLSQYVEQLSSSTFVTKLYYFVSNIDADIARATLQDHQLNIPLTVEAAGCGLILATLLQAIIQITYNLLDKRRRKSLKNS